jgi:hypothetical protein
MLRFKEWSKKTKVAAVLLLLVYVFVWVVVGFVVGRKIANAEVKSPIGSLINEEIVPTVADIPNPINGVFYTKKEAAKWQKRVPLAVMIENHSLARPHSSVSKAEVVYEALAEGGVTRFVVIFLADNSSRDLGPVRSARQYYIDWAREYDAVYAHWGGNEGVRAKAKAVFGSKDFDQFVIGYPTYFKRAPWYVHDSYTTTKGLWKAAHKICQLEI